MSYLSIESFRLGRDARKSELTSQPGTLVTLENAFINTGGEIQKRKAFVRDATALTSTFGIEVVDLGVVTFWSGAPGASPPSLPSGVTAIKLVHPVIAQSLGTYAEAYHALTAVPFSVNFNGKPFAAGKFADGNTYFFYDYTLSDGIYVASGITESYAGLALVTAAAGTVMTTDELAAQLETQMENALSGYDIARTAGPTQLAVRSPAGQSFASTFTNSSDVVIAAATASSGFAGTGSPGCAKFAVPSSGGTGAWNITADLYPSGSVVLMNTTVETDNATTIASLIVASINAGTVSHGFTAVMGGVANVFVYFPIAYGTEANTLQIHVTAPVSVTAVAASETPNLTFKGFVIDGVTINEDYTVKITKHGATGFMSTIAMSTSSIKAAVTGGSVTTASPYKYKWIYLSGDLKTTVSNDEAESVVFKANVQVYYDRTSMWQCEVEDNLGNIVTSPTLTITLQYRV